MMLNGITADRLHDRKQSARSRRSHCAATSMRSGTMDGLDAFTQQAFGMLTSSKLVDALDLSQEDAARPRTLRQGRSEELRRRRAAQSRTLPDGPPAWSKRALACVTLNFGRWDFHSDNFNGVKNTHLPLFDQGMTALVEDLHERGLDKDVAVVAWGEFGRTPLINKDAGRDHWPQVGGGSLAGGGLKTGQVIGATDRLGGELAERPVHFGEVLATLYQHLGSTPKDHDPQSRRSATLLGRRSSAAAGIYLKRRGVQATTARPLCGTLRTGRGSDWEAKCGRRYPEHHADDHRRHRRCVVCP